MKHLYLLVIIAVVCLNLTAQNRVIDSHNKNLTQDKLNIAQNPTFKLPGDLVYFSPIDAWAVSEMITQLWDNNAWMNMAKTNNSYNANGLLTDDMNYSWSGSDWVVNARETYSYDANIFWYLHYQKIGKVMHGFKNTDLPILITGKGKHIPGCLNPTSQVPGKIQAYIHIPILAII